MTSYEAGDILGFSGGDRTGRIINLATLGWPLAWPAHWRGLSHVAIVAGYRCQKVLFESTTLCDLPCMIQGATINGVQAHAIEDRVRWYHDRGGVVWHYRLRRPLSCLEEVDLNHFCRRMIGRRYDWTGAIGSRNTLGAFVRRRIFTAEDLAALFCSEFCAAALVKVNRLECENVSGLSPNAFCRLGVRQDELCFPGRVYPLDTPARAA
jgi:hypothetical protein